MGGASHRQVRLGHVRKVAGNLWDVLDEGEEYDQNILYENFK